MTQGGWLGSHANRFNFYMSPCRDFFKVSFLSKLLYTHFFISLPVRRTAQQISGTTDGIIMRCAKKVEKLRKCFRTKANIITATDKNNYQTKIAIFNMVWHHCYMWKAPQMCFFSGHKTYNCGASYHSKKIRQKLMLLEYVHHRAKNKILCTGR